MRPIDLESARQLLDFAGTASEFESSYAESQLEGTVAATSMLVRNGVAYLADEVGLGKTYVALGVMALLRHQNPDARILVIAPRENIQRKWIKEQSNFVRHNWRVRDGRVKTLDDRPARDAVFCSNLREWVHELSIDDRRDMFLRMTSFSLAVGESEARKKLRKQLRRSLPWLQSHDVPVRTYDGFLEELGRLLNGWLPAFDLVVVDEAHNLKHGVPQGRSGSVRNRLMASVFGSASFRGRREDPLRRIAQRVLLLSATPFESEYGAVQRQLDVFGHGQARIADAAGADPRPLTILARDPGHETTHRELLGRMMLRRIAHLRIGDEHWTKNMYRREWRNGGYTQHDEPITLDDPRTRLVVGLMQKKVSEVLQDERFGNHFQIGMLSSFESFLESVAHCRQHQGAKASTDEVVFEGEQDARTEERKGIDTDALGEVVESHRERFGTSLPHPKLDMTVEALADTFDTGEKALVFVRRVATVRELGEKLNEYADRWLRDRMRTLLPDLHGEIDDLFDQYKGERRKPGRTGQRSTDSVPTPFPDDDPEGLSSLVADDEGGLDSFFSWFFRGKGPYGVLSGAAFQKNRLTGIGSVYSTMFEDDHVGWVLGRPDDVLAALATAVGLDRASLRDRLRHDAWRHFRGRSTREKGYPRLHVFEGYQAAALGLLARGEGDVAERARRVLHDRYPPVEPAADPMPDGFPGLSVGIGVRTVFTELEKRPALRECLWPAEDGEFAYGFRRRETRRELMSAMARLGAAYVDLYLLAIGDLGTFRLGGADTSEDNVHRLIDAWLDLLEAQATTRGFTGRTELEAAARTFDTILAVNFHEAPAKELWELPRLFGSTLQRQVPVGAMAGQVNHRLVRQFRMPGLPRVLVTTDVLQEGEDLHTFCRRVIHYGISWTPSAMEQRTGRVDRIGSLVQRDLDRSTTTPDDARKIQVHFPHLQDTVEVLQVRRVLRRMNRFLHLIHDTDFRPETRDSRVDVGRELTRDDAMEDLIPITEPLRSAFPVRQEWLSNGTGPWAVPRLDEDALRAHLEQLWSWFRSRYRSDEIATGRAWRREGVLWLHDDSTAASHDVDHTELRRQHFAVQVHAGRTGGHLYLQCESAIGEVDLDDVDMVERMEALQRELGLVKLAVRPVGKGRLWQARVARSILFGPDITQPEEFERLTLRVVGTADCFEAELLHADADSLREVEDDA